MSPRGGGTAALWSGLDVVVGAVRRRTELLAMAALLLAIPFLPRDIGFGVVGLGLFSAAGLVLHAYAMILIYRINRVINFSQVAIGAAAATFLVSWVRAAPAFRGVAKICPPCFEKSEFRNVNVLAVPTALQHANYVVAILLGLGFAVLLAIACSLLAKRFSTAPRLIVTVATIFLAQALAAVSTKVTDRMASADKRTFVVPPVYSNETSAAEVSARGIDLGPVPPTFDLTLDLDPITFSFVQLATVAVAILASLALALYFRRSDSGTAIRAVAENPGRAATLGLDVAAVTRKVWIVAGLLSGLAGVVLAMSQGAPGAAAPGETTAAIDFGLGLLVRILTIAVLARMASLPMVALGAVVLGLFEQSMLWSFGSTVLVDGVLLVIIVVVLLVQRHGMSRAEVEQAAAWQADREIRPIPRELRSLPAVRSWLRKGAFALAIVVLGLPWVLSPIESVLASSTIILGILGLSLLVLTGWAGQISLGQFALAAVAAYVVAVTTPSLLLALPMAAVVGGVSALVLGLPALRLRGLHLAIVTLAFALATSSILLSQDQLGKHLPARLARPPLLGLDLESERVFYYFVLGVFVLMALGVQGLRRSRTARALIACRDNEQQAESYGINLVRARLSAFGLSGALAGVAGALYAYAQHGVAITSFPADQSVYIFLVSVVGGFGAVLGPLLGVIGFGLIDFFNLGANRTLILGFGGLALTLFVGGGLSQLMVRVRDSMLRRVATRYRIVVPSLIADVRVEGRGPDVARIATKHRPGGGEVFVPSRYKVGDQWALGDVVARREVAELREVVASDGVRPDTEKEPAGA